MTKKENEIIKNLSLQLERIKNKIKLLGVANEMGKYNKEQEIIHAIEERGDFEEAMEAMEQYQHGLIDRHNASYSIAIALGLAKGDEPDESPSDFDPGDTPTTNN